MSNPNPPSSDESNPTKETPTPIPEPTAEAQTEIATGEVNPVPQDLPPEAPVPETPVVDTAQEPTSTKVDPSPGPLKVKRGPQLPSTTKAFDGSKKTLTVSVKPRFVQTPSASVKTKIVANAGGETVQQLVEKANQQKNVPMQTLQEDLLTAALNLSRERESDEKTAARHMAGLYSLLVRTINNDKTPEEFKEQWGFVIQAFKEHQKGGLGPHRVYRGVAQWTLTHEAYKLYSRLLNLIEVTIRYENDRAAVMRLVDFNNFNVSALTESGRGRLFSYYL